MEKQTLAHSAFFDCPPEVFPTYVQLELIPNTPLETLSLHVKELKASNDKVRKCVFAKVTKNAKKVEELECQINDLKAQIQTLNDFILEKLNTLAFLAPKDTDTDQSEELSHVTRENAMFANSSQVFAMPEISQTAILRVI